MLLWSGLWIARLLEIKDISIYGDSKVIIDDMSGKSELFLHEAQGWIDKVKYLISKFASVSWNHIFRENNSRADKLSKKGLISPPGSLHILKIWDVCSSSFTIPIL